MSNGLTHSDFETSDNERGYLDSVEFVQFSAKVNDIIKAHGNPTTADINRALGEHNRHWTMDALQALVGVGVIEYQISGLMSRWVSKDAPVDNRPAYNSTLFLSPSTRTLPTTAMSGGVDSLCN